jgi:2'-5' RNA ligase
MDKSTRTIRTFIAIPIEFAAVEGVYRHLKQVLSQEKIKWVEPYQFHLTLQFIGDTPLDIVEDIKSLLESLHWEKTIINFDGLGVFSSRGIPKVLFVKTEPNEVLQKLHRIVHEKVGRLVELKEENRAFVPHLTLGRIKFMKNKERFYNDVDKFSVKFKFESPLDKIIFYKSTLTPKGPVYNELLVHKC